MHSVARPGIIGGFDHSGPRREAGKPDDVASGRADTVEINDLVLVGFAVARYELVLPAAAGVASVAGAAIRMSSSSAPCIAPRPRPPCRSSVTRCSTAAIVMPSPNVISPRFTPCTTSSSPAAYSGAAVLVARAQVGEAGGPCVGDAPDAAGTDEAAEAGIAGVAGEGIRPCAADDAQHVRFGRAEPVGGGGPCRDKTVEDQRARMVGPRGLVGATRQRIADLRRRAGLGQGDGVGPRQATLVGCAPWPNQT